MRKTLITFSLLTALGLAVTGCGTSGTKSVENEYIKVTNYNNLPVEELTATEVTDEDVESEINTNLEADTEEKEVKRAAKSGDVVNIDYVGKIDGEEFDGGSAEDYDLELGSDTFIGANGDYKGFEEQIIGHKAGEEFDIEVKFPENYSDTLKNKVATFSITLNTVKEKTVPTLTDDWVQENSETSKTAEEYKEEIRTQLEEANEEEVKSQQQQDILKSLQEQIEVIKVPEEKKEELQEQLTSTYKSYAEQYGMTEDQFNELMEVIAEENAELYMALDLIAEKEDLVPSDDALQEKYEEYAEEYGYESVDTLLEAVEEDELKELAIQEAVCDYLLEHAQEMSAEEYATAFTSEETTETTEDTSSESDTAGEEDTAEEDTAEESTDDADVEGDSAE